MTAVKKQKTSILIDVAVIAVSIILALAFIKFVGFFSTVSGSSMNPTYKDGNKVIVASLNVKRQINRFDVVITKIDGVTLIKRVVGLPGETIAIEDGHIKINGKTLDDIALEKIEHAGCLDTPLYISSDSYVLLGDNRNNSFDSRDFGAVNRSDIKGVVVFHFQSGH